MRTDDVTQATGEELRFPAGFAWGTATASYQIEGAVRRGRPRTVDLGHVLAHAPARWPAATPATSPTTTTTATREDVALLADLGVDSLPLLAGLAAAAADRAAARSTEAGLDFYQRLVDELLARDIQPLGHALPLGPAAGAARTPAAGRSATPPSGSPSTPRPCTTGCSDRVRTWTTLNEPWCSAFLGYAAGRHAPGRTEPARRAGRRPPPAARARAGRARRCGRRTRGSSLGITLNLHPVDPATDGRADVDAARRVDAVTNRVFLDPLLPRPLSGRPARGRRRGVRPRVRRGRRRADHRRADRLARRELLPAHRGVRRRRAREPNAAWVGSEQVGEAEQGLPATAMGWEIDPSGLYDVLRRISRRLPGRCRST